MARTTDMSETIDRMLEIQQEIRALTQEAYDLIPRDANNLRNAAYGYWYAHILGALDDDSPFVGGSMMTIQDTIDGLQAADEDENEGGDS